MQDKFVADIGDFAKYGLVRAMLRHAELKAGFVWYLVPDSASDNYGQHTKYLTEPGSAIRDCDPELFGKLAKMVQDNRRFVSEIPGTGILPRETVFYEPRLELPPGASIADRLARRKAWFESALSATADCQIVVLDPDNGLESPSVTSVSRNGPKYVYFDELSRFYGRGQSVVIYHHFDRSAKGKDQAQRRMKEIRHRIGAELVVAMRWKRVSPRFYFVIAAEEHEEALSTGIRALMSSPWSNHFELINIED